MSTQYRCLGNRHRCSGNRRIVVPCASGIATAILAIALASSTQATQEATPPSPPTPAEPNPSAPANPPAEAAIAKPAEKPAAEGIAPDWLAWGRKNLKRKDKDSSGFLTPDEFSDASVPFKDVDTNSDGQISVEEYAAHRAAR